MGKSSIDWEGAKAYPEFTQLQMDALFYRNPSGVGSQGGYDCLFAHLPCECPYPDLNDRDKSVWEWHWNYCNGLPQVQKDLICNRRKSVRELGEVPVP